jgi:hypothetical protein
MTQISSDSKIDSDGWPGGGPSGPGEGAGAGAGYVTELQLLLI